MSDQLMTNVRKHGKVVFLLTRKKGASVTKVRKLEKLCFCFGELFMQVLRLKYSDQMTPLWRKQLHGTGKKIRSELRQIEVTQNERNQQQFKSRMDLSIRKHALTGGKPFHKEPRVLCVKTFRILCVALSDQSGRKRIISCRFNPPLQRSRSAVTRVPLTTMQPQLLPGF